MEKEIMVARYLTTPRKEAISAPDFLDVLGLRVIAALFV